MLHIPHRLSREFISTHTELIFVHSKCYWPNHCVGPCEMCKGLSHCYGIPVRWKLCKSSGYFSDSNEAAIRRIIDEAIAKIPTGDKPIILFPKIGNGQSRMKEFAPKCWAYMMQRLEAIKSKDYCYDYNHS